MGLPIELVMDKESKGLALKVSSLVIFGGKQIIVPEDKITRLGFFSLTSEYRSSISNYAVQNIEKKLLELGRNNANAYRVIRKRRYTEHRPYTEFETTNFQSYNIPEELAEEERKKKVQLIFM